MIHSFPMSPWEIVPLLLKPCGVLPGIAGPASGLLKFGGTTPFGFLIANIGVPPLLPIYVAAGSAVVPSETDGEPVEAITEEVTVWSCVTDTPSEKIGAVEPVAGSGARISALWSVFSVLVKIVLDIFSSLCEPNNRRKYDQNRISQGTSKKESPKSIW